MMFSTARYFNKICIFLILFPLCLFVRTGVHAQSRGKIEQVKTKEVVPKTQEGFEMTADVLDEFGRESNSENFKMQINSGGQASPIGRSEDSVFTLLAGYVYAVGWPSVTVISPNGGEGWQAGHQYPITWSSEGAGNVRIDYSINSGASFDSIICLSCPNTGEYLWTVPCSTSSNSCRVRVCDATDCVPADASDSDFTITYCIPPIPVLTNYGIIVLLILLMGTAVWMIKRKRLVLERNN